MYYWFFLHLCQIYSHLQTPNIEWLLVKTIKIEKQNKTKQTNKKQKEINNQTNKQTDQKKKKHSLAAATLINR